MYPRMPIDDSTVLRDLRATDLAAAYLRAALAEPRYRRRDRVPRRPNILLRRLRAMPDC